ncbi:MAG TPA: STAS domain-containing protein [Solirubrobacteraceae bacterium]|jgi:anti-anti-sigma factor|nr:STAS domain-containing protein [Solirubrobacteraceae bacterium]
MSVPAQFEIDVRQSPNRAVIALIGELDIARAPMLSRIVDGSALADVKYVVLDLERLEFMDSSGLRVVIVLREQCRERGQHFSITNATRQVQHLLDVIGLSESPAGAAVPAEDSA